MNVDLKCYTCENRAIKVSYIVPFCQRNSLTCSNDFLFCLFYVFIQAWFSYHELVFHSRPVLDDWATFCWGGWVGIIPMSIFVGAADRVRNHAGLI